MLSIILAITLLVDKCMVSSCSSVGGGGELFEMTITRDPVSNAPMIDVIVNHGFHMKSLITISSKTKIPMMERSEPVTIGLIHSGQTGVTDLHVATPRRSDSIASIGIGPTSAMVESFSSVLYYRDPAVGERLVVGLPASALRDKCAHPVSRVSLYLLADAGGEESSTIDQILKSVVAIEDQVMSSWVTFDMVEPRPIVLSGLAARMIARKIESLGGIQYEENIFRKCDSTLLSSLPVITVSLETVSEETSSLNFNFLPRDYLQIDESNSFCRIVVSDKTDIPVIGINPFQVAGMNFVIAESYMSFCDLIKTTSS